MSLEVGNTSETVVVQGGAEIVQTQSANISTTLSVNQIANLPLVSRDTLNFVVMLPGVSTPGVNRDSTINGLPQSAINITIDGINSQDNYLKTSDGFFSRISPRLDSVEEVTVSTATPGAESGGQGAVQIKFVTRRGNNEFHGSLYEYHRNPVLNSNYWFNNRDLPQLHTDTVSSAVRRLNRVSIRTSARRKGIGFFSINTASALVVRSSFQKGFSAPQALTDGTERSSLLITKSSGFQAR